MVKLVRLDSVGNTVGKTEVQLKPTTEPSKASGEGVIENLDDSRKDLRNQKVEDNLSNITVVVQDSPEMLIINTSSSQNKNESPDKVSNMQGQIYIANHFADKQSYGKRRSSSHL